MAVKIRRIVMIIGAGIMGLTVLTACNLPSDPGLEVRYPYCLTTSGLGPTYLEYPPQSAIIEELSPTFNWTYPGDCIPRNFQIQVNNSSNCNHWSDSASLLINEEIGGYREWTPDTLLEPLSGYQWRVAPIIHEEMGEYSDFQCFWTGPVCDAASLEAPILVGGPADGAVIDTDYVILGWSYPGECLPEGYQPELSDDPAFPPPNYMSELPTDVVSPTTGQVSGEILFEDCTTYYWRVSARIGSAWGPASVVKTFSTDFDGTCDDTKGEEAPSPTPVGPSATPLEGLTGTPTYMSPTPVATTHSPTPVPTTRTPTPPPTNTYTPHPPTRTLTPTMASPTPPPDNQPPPVPNPISPSGNPTLVCTSNLTVNWEAVSDPSGIAEYRVQLGRHSGDNNWSPPPGSPYTGITGTSVSVQVECGWYYRWRVRAIDGADNWSDLSSWAYFIVSLE